MSDVKTVLCVVSAVAKITVQHYAKEDFIRDVLRKTNGKVFSCEFFTKKGEYRKKAVRIGVRKGLVGGINTTAHLSNYEKVYVMSDRKYNNVDLNNIKSIKCGGIQYEFS